MDENEYLSVDQLRGSMSQRKVVDSAAFERAQYMRALVSLDDRFI
jgi:dihydroorotate dehydrogenase (fumarate)